MSQSSCEAIQTTLVRRYGLQDKQREQAMDVFYLRTRAMMGHITAESLADFLCAELLLLTEGEGELVSVMAEWMDTYYQQLVLAGDEFVRKSDLLSEEYERWAQHARKLFHISSRRSDLLLLQKGILDLIGMAYDLDMHRPTPLDGSNILPFGETIEDRMAKVSDLTPRISEQTLQTYLENHIHMLEDGLSVLSRKMKTSVGEPDIVAIDRDNNFATIELKVDDDDQRLTCQVQMYPEAVANRYKTELRWGNKKMRMIVVSPPLSFRMRLSMEWMEYVDLYEFSAIAKNGTIENISFEKVITAKREFEPRFDSRLEHHRAA